jgi:serine/threonine protein kinase
MRPLPQDAYERPFEDLSGRVVRTDEEYFGYGGFSYVYKGVLTHAPGHQPTEVAIKVLRSPHANPSDSTILRRRLHRETHIWHQLEHPNILPFLGISQDFDRSPALISPLCSNGDALNYVKTHPETDRFNLIIGICKGLQYLHSEDVIHGDLKGRNVVIDDNKNPRLCDFGRSKIVDHKGYTTIFTGSVQYIAPELLQFVQTGTTLNGNDAQVPDLTKESDIYSLGIVALEMLSGRAVWEHCNDSFVLAQVLLGNRPDRQEYAVNDALWSILCRCWHQLREVRPTISVVLDEFLRLVDP